MAGFLLRYPAMRGIYRNIAILLALSALALTGVAGTAEARGGKLGAAATKMTRGAQIKLNRMKQKLSRTTRGAGHEKTRRQLNLGKRQLQRAMGRRDVGLHGSESERTRQRFAHDMDRPHDRNDQAEDIREQGKKLRERAKRRASDDTRRKKRRH